MPCGHLFVLTKSEDTGDSKATNSAYLPLSFVQLLRVSQRWRRDVSTALIKHQPLFSTYSNYNTGCLYTMCESSAMTLSIRGDLLDEMKWALVQDRGIIF